MRTIRLNNYTDKGITVPASEEIPRNATSGRAILTILRNRLMGKIDEHKELMRLQLLADGTYDPARWRNIDRLEGQIERLKGAVALARWLSGESDVIDLELRGYIKLGASMDAALDAIMQHDEEERRREAATPKVQGDW